MCGQGGGRGDGLAGACSVVRKLARRMRVFLALVACAHAVSAQCDAATEAAESTCKRDNACTACSDFNYGDDCATNSREHCDEVECCPACEAEIRAMFACEHGASCGSTLTCPVAAGAGSTSTTCPVRAPAHKSLDAASLCPARPKLPAASARPSVRVLACSRVCARARAWTCG